MVMGNGVAEVISTKVLHLIADFWGEPVKLRALLRKKTGMEKVAEDMTKLKIIAKQMKLRW